MSAGTITLTNNSDAVAGTGTAFLTDLTAGDFIVANVGGIAYTLPVKAVASDTALTIASKFSGPTMSGLAWFVVKRDQQAMITAALVAQSTEALRGLNYDKANWQAVFSAAGDITVTLSDNTQFTGPSWQKIVTLLAQSDIEVIQPLAEQVRADAQQVAADKLAAETAKTDAQAAGTAAVSAASSASESQTSASASADAAAASLSETAGYKNQAEDARNRAEEAAASLDTSNFVRKDQPVQGRAALDVYSKDEVEAAIRDGGSGIPLGFRYNHSNRAKLNPGTTPLDGQVVTITGSFADLADHAEANEPTATEADWQDNPGKRGCFVIDRTAGTMRLPDMNGVQVGSLGPMYQTGDSGTTAAGTMTQNAAPDVHAWNEGYSILGRINDTNVAGNAARLSVGIGNYYGNLNPVGGYGSRSDIKLSNGHPSYGRDGATRVKPDSVHGCWVIQYANAAQNSGEIDALSIDTDLQAFKATQQQHNSQYDEFGKRISAWAIITGAGSPSVVAGANIASVTLLEVGILQVNFSTPMANINYAVNVTFDPDVDGVLGYTVAGGPRTIHVANQHKTVNSFRIYSGAMGSTSTRLNYRGYNISVCGGK